MNENLNLCEILKDCPKGTKLYSPLFGECELIQVTHGGVGLLTSVGVHHLNNKGKFFLDSECLLFPSKDNQDWSTFKAPKPEPQFKPFDRVLVRDFDDDPWYNSTFGFISNNKDRQESGWRYNCEGRYWKKCIPYEGNESLLGTMDEPKED